MAAIEVGWTVQGHPAPTHPGAHRSRGPGQARRGATTYCDGGTCRDIRGRHYEAVGRPVAPSAPTSRAAGTFHLRTVRRSVVDRPTIGHLRLDTLTPSDIRKVVTSQEDAGLAFSTMQRTTRCWARFLRTLWPRVIRSVSARARETGGPGQGESPRQALCVEDAMKILAVAAGRPDASRWVAALVEGLRPAGSTRPDLGHGRSRRRDHDARLAAQDTSIRRTSKARQRVPRPRGFESRKPGRLSSRTPKDPRGSRVIPPFRGSSTRSRRGMNRHPHHAGLCGLRATARRDRRRSTGANGTKSLNKRRSR